jgi:hypothetical protein
MQSTLAARVDLQLLAVGSEGIRSETLCRDAGFEYVEHANEPLSHKWNAGVRAAESFSPDAVVIIGSDDLLSSELLSTYADRLDEGHEFFGLLDLYFFDLTASTLGYWPGYHETSTKGRSGEPIGCGRCLSRSVLEATGWNLWPREPRLNELLDGAALKFLNLNGFQHVAWTLDEIGAKAVDIKSAVNITRFESIPYKSRVTGAPALDYVRDLLTEQETDRLLRLRRDTKAS